MHANVMDQGGGIGKVVWRINETTVATDSYADSSTSRLATAGQTSLKTDLITLQQQFTLLPGNNTVELVAYNQRNEIASSPAVLTLTVTPPAEAPPMTAQSSPATATPSWVELPPPAVPQPTAAPPDLPLLTEPTVLATDQKPLSEAAATAPALTPAATYDMVAPGDATSTTASITLSLQVPNEKHADLMQPALHLLVVGINRYRDKALRLKYAVQDGRAIAEIIRETGASLFRDVRVTLLFDDQVTMEGIDEAFRQVKATIAPQDVFMFYLAGHGVTRNGRYYFLPYDFRYYSDEAIQRNAVNQDHLQNWLALIPARKSLVLIDTCESGSFTQSMVAMRGMAAKTAIAKLTRATGRATIVASTDEQPAVEGYQGHGVFTYVLLEGLRHADARFGNRDGYTGLFELAAFVNDQVPSITMNAFNFEQIPQVHMVGTDFPIGVVTIKGS